MQTGDVIKIFPDTDVLAYEKMIHDMGFKCKVQKSQIIVGDSLRESEEQRRIIGRTITQGMKQKKLSRKDLSEIIGANPYSIWGWQIGRIAPCEYYRKKLRQVLEVEI